MNPGIIPLGDRVVVSRIDQESMSEGGIPIPETNRERAQEGIVIFVGPGKLIDGKRTRPPLEVGEHVLFTKYVGTELRRGGVDYLVLREDDILGRVQGE